MARRRNAKQRTSPVNSSTDSSSPLPPNAASTPPESVAAAPSTMVTGGTTNMNVTNLPPGSFKIQKENRKARQDPMTSVRQQYSATSRAIKNTLLAGVLGYYFQRALKPWILPWGSPSHQRYSAQQHWAPVDYSNDSLRIRHGRTQKIWERMTGSTTTVGHREGEELRFLKGPETVVVGKDGSLYVMTEEAKLFKLVDIQPNEDNSNSKGDVARMTADMHLVKELGIGRPLGGRFTSDGSTLYVADAVVGLLRIRNPHDSKAVVEMVASSARDLNGKVTPITFANDVAIGPKSGTVYFTDSTEIRPDRIRAGNMDHKFVWDTLYASKIDFIRGIPTGRLLAYYPSTNQVEVLAKNLAFPNGLAVDAEENFLFLAETFGPRLLMYHLKGDQKGRLETVVPTHNMTGYPDGVDCYWSKEKKETLCYAAIASGIVPVHRILSSLSGLLSVLGVLLRTVLMCIPRYLAPEPARYGAVIEVNINTRELRYIQDPTGADLSMLTSVRVHDGRLYLGSLTNQYIGVYQLS